MILNLFVLRQTRNLNVYLVRILSLLSVSGYAT